MEPIVKTSKGSVRGVTSDGTLVFKGIPFAKPPVGALRFRPPKPAVAWEGVRDATAFGPIPMQMPNDALEAVFGRPAERPPMSEDCLYLNVWTPATDGKRRPVMFWIYGGGFTIGSGSEPIYDGRAFAARDVVLVTINYRLGAFGYLCHEDFIDFESEFQANFGMLDQLAALKWVQEEIEAFGGDSNNVTIFGESAGALSVGALMASPLAKGLFARAILESGAAHMIVSLQQARSTFDLLAEKLGIKSPTVQAMRSHPADEILKAQKEMEVAARAEMGAPLGLGLQPIVDGRFLTERAIKAIRAGHSRDVSALIGTNRDEWKLYAASMPALKKITEQDVVLRVSRLTRDAERGQAVYDAYREARSARGEAVDPFEILSAVMTDLTFRVPADRLAEAQVAFNPQVFSYRFDWPSPLGNGILGSCHALELPFVFGVQRAATQLIGGGPEADALAQQIGDAWVAFARTGDPSTDDLRWPAFNVERRPTMILDRDCRVEELPREQERRCWDGIIR
jgi:para-nitrobenzyl esterase